MAAKPAFLERLRHGRAICGKNFPKFVETFNWLVNSLFNLSGDGDGNGNGPIVVDWAAEDRPIVKLDTARLKIDGGGGCFSVIGTDGTSATVGTGTAEHSLTFASAADSDVVVSVAGDDNGNVTATIGVYWK